MGESARLDSWRRRLTNLAARLMGACAESRCCPWRHDRKRCSPVLVGGEPGFAETPVHRESFGIAIEMSRVLRRDAVPAVSQVPFPKASGSDDPARCHAASLSPSSIPRSVLPSNSLPIGAGNVSVRPPIPYNIAHRPRPGENCGRARDARSAPGEVPKWPNGPDSNSAESANLPGVRIPPSPPI